MVLYEGEGESDAGLIKSSGRKSRKGLLKFIVRGGADSGTSL